MKTIFKLVVCFVILASCGKKQDMPDQAVTPVDPLPSWNEGATKSAIIDFVIRSTATATPEFIPVADRIATFDNDGTLWTERPYIQELFTLFRVKKMVAKNPALAKKQPYKSVIEEDKTYVAKGGDKALIEVFIAGNTGTSEEEYEKDVKDFFASVVYPDWNVPIKQVRFQPQLELMNYLRDNGFKVYICSGGTTEFIRMISEDFYSVPVEQVVGSSFKYVFADSSRKIYRQPEFAHFNDKGAKPAGIQLHIGKHPVFACGNEGGRGDIAMLKFSQASKYLSLQLLVNHDDEAREHFYSESDSASLKAAALNHWTVISMKNDWKTVFAK